MASAAQESFAALGENLFFERLRGCRAFRRNVGGDFDVREVLC